MKHSDFCEFMQVYVKGTYGLKHGWEIAISTPKRKGSKWSDVDGENRYTMYVYAISNDKKTLVAKSKEFKGYNKNNWTGAMYGEFVSSLSKVENE